MVGLESKISRFQMDNPLYFRQRHKQCPQLTLGDVFDDIGVAVF
jgi:hypothetical protein